MRSAPFYKRCARAPRPGAVHAPHGRERARRSHVAVHRVQVGMTLGIMTFASLTNFGNSAGTPFVSDLGVRLSGPACACVFLVALAAFAFYDERTLRRETYELQRQRDECATGAAIPSPAPVPTVEEMAAEAKANKGAPGAR